MTLIDDIRDAGGLIETCDVQTIIGYIQRGELTPAGELLSQAAHLQEACMNSLKADVLWKLCDRLGEYEPVREACAAWQESGLVPVPDRVEVEAVQSGGWTVGWIVTGLVNDKPALTANVVQNSDGSLTVDDYDMCAGFTSDDDN